MNSLSIIIPFLNEGEEIENTVKNIRSYANDSVDIILINDASEDNYNYRDIAQKYRAVYIYNSLRKGVAQSRDLGIERCVTPYFLLLDGHMRFYDAEWVRIITSLLNKDDRVLLCCQTRFLLKKGTELEEIYNKAYGAYICFGETWGCLDVKWKSNEQEPDLSVEDIPCVLGAVYAASRRYWQYLKGLIGLQGYGSDEAYISLKVWLEGGRCKLLKNVEVGHVYRTKFPYKVDSAQGIYNKLVIAELLFPTTIKCRIFANLKRLFPADFSCAYTMLIDNNARWEVLKCYYQQIFTKNTTWLMQLYNNVKQENNYPDKAKMKEQLEQIVNRLLEEKDSFSDVGLMDGKMGIVLFYIIMQPMLKIYH